MKTIYKVIIAILILVLIWEYYYFVERKAIEIDRYNFQQLEKAKKVVKNLKWEQKLYRARGLKDFNYQFDTDIEPLDKRYCYYVYYDYDKENNKPVFEFWFKLHSLLYKLKYLSLNYAYPKLIKKEWPSEECERQVKTSVWYTWVPACFGWYYYRYLRIINNPCER